VVFNSLQFLIFFPIVLAAYLVLPRNIRWAWLLVASLYAIVAIGPIFLLPLLAVAALGFVFGVGLDRQGDPGRKRSLLVVALVAVVAPLFGLKYATFVNESLRDATSLLGASYPVPVLRALIPIGISFYTLQIIGYLVDVYRGQPAERHAGRFLLFVAFFPKLVAGPIERGRSLLPQISKAPSVEVSDLTAGLQLMAWGAFKKVVVADRLAPFVQRAYGEPLEQTGVTMVFATVVFALQIYCDFSGYSDLAIGAARTFGYRLMRNFDRPYSALSVQEFWKRWHISLTSWLTDYVYTPFTRNRVLKLKWYYMMLVGLFITFLVSGLWHGAEWTFVLWGALHGAYLVGSMLTQRLRARWVAAIGLTSWPRLHRSLKVSTTFALVCVAYVMFKASSVTEAIGIYAGLLSGWSSPLDSVRTFIYPDMAEFLIGISAALFVLWIEKRQAGKEVEAYVAGRSRPVRWAMYYAVAVMIVVLGAFYEDNQQFIYFQF